MGVQPFDSEARGVRGVHRIALPATGSGARRVLRRRLVVVTPTLVEAVRFAGCWLFDRAMAGWDVTVLRADRADARPLRVLGARAARLEPVLASPVRGPRPRAIAVHADLCVGDPRVRRMVLDALDECSVEVCLWGELWPADLDGGAGSVRHRPSTAALAFKAQALAAAAVPAEARETIELFRSAEPLLRPPGRA